MKNSAEKPLYGTISQTRGTYSVTYKNGQRTGYSEDVFKHLPKGTPIIDFSQVDFKQALSVSFKTPVDHKEDIPKYLEFLKENGIPVSKK